MAGPHEKFAALADRLIKKHGRPLLICKLSTEPFDPSKPWRAGGPADGGPRYDDKVEVIGVVTVYEEDEIDGENIRSTDERVLVAARAAVGKSLEGYNTILDGDRPLCIYKGSVLQPGTTRILYDFQIRQ